MVQLTQRTLAIWGSITVQLTTCLFCLDSKALLMWNHQQIYLFGQIQTSHTGGQQYSDTSPYGLPNKYLSSVVEYKDNKMSTT